MKTFWRLIFSCIAADLILLMLVSHGVPRNVQNILLLTKVGGVELLDIVVVGWTIVGGAGIFLAIERLTKKRKK